MTWNIICCYKSLGVMQSNPKTVHDIEEVEPNVAKLGLMV